VTVRVRVKRSRKDGEVNKEVISYAWIIESRENGMGMGKGGPLNIPKSVTHVSLMSSWLVPVR